MNVPPSQTPPPGAPPPPPAPPAGAPAGAPYYAPPVAASGPSGPRAGFWQRFGAALLDGIVVGIPFVILLLALKGVGYAIGIVLEIAYFTYFEGGPNGQTPGKTMLSIRIISIDNAQPIGYQRGLIRALARIISTIPFYLGYIWMLWDPQRQTWHDKFARSIVVPTAASPVNPR